MSLADTAEEGDSSTYRANGRLIAWPWMERIDPRKPRVANRDVLVVRVATEMDKDALIDLDPAAFFTEPHYDGYAAILIRLASVDLRMLEKLINDSWTLAISKPAPRRTKRAANRSG
jgi:hypothetical protein